MRLVISTCYKEGSISALATHADATDSLERFYTTAALTKAAKFSEKIPIIGAAVSRQLRRRAFTGIREDRVTCTGWKTEMVHVLIRRSFSGRLRLPSSLMYHVKENFDMNVASDLRKYQTDAVIGMWGSSLHTFKSAGTQTLKVLNFVNSRPSFHNKYLRDLGGVNRADPEMIPAKTEARIEAELELADLILIPSRFIARQLSDFQTKLAVIPYGVNTTAFSPGESDTRFACDVLFMGQISHRKGVSTLVEVARVLTRYKFLFIGPVVSPELLRSLPGNVSIIGAISHEEAPLAMRSARTFVLPSFEDSYGLVVIEAMASGTLPIVSTNVGASEFIDPGVNGLIFAAGDPGALLTALEKSLSDSSWRESLSCAASSKASSLASWPSYSRSVFNEISRRLPLLNIDNSKHQSERR